VFVKIWKKKPTQLNIAAKKTNHQKDQQTKARMHLLLGTT